MHYETDHQQPNEDAETSVAEEQVQDVGEHQGVSDTTQDVGGAATKAPGAPPSETSPAQVKAAEVTSEGEQLARSKLVSFRRL